MRVASPLHIRGMVYLTIDGDDGGGSVCGRWGRGGRRKGFVLEVEEGLVLTRRPAGRPSRQSQVSMIAGAGFVG